MSFSETNLPYVLVHLVRALGVSRRYLSKHSLSSSHYSGPIRSHKTLLYCFQ